MGRGRHRGGGNRAFATRRRGGRIGWHPGWVGRHAGWVGRHAGWVGWYAGWVGRHAGWVGWTPDAVHALWHDLLAIAAYRAGSGDRVPEQRGVVDRISVSRGGVPKLAVVTADVGRRGLAGDRQRTRRHHGRPWQALCLWSGEVIDALVAEGHPIAPGAAGENLTLRGLDWSRLRAGAVLQIGPVRGQLSAPAMPCAKNNRWFSTNDSARIDHGLHPGWSRWYASVLVPGPVAIGDIVTVS